MPPWSGYYGELTASMLSVAWHHHRRSFGKAGGDLWRDGGREESHPKRYWKSASVRSSNSRSAPRNEGVDHVIDTKAAGQH